MTRMQLSPVALVGLQFAIAACLVISMDLRAMNVVVVALVTGGILLGIWAWLSLGKQRLQIMPEPNANAHLVTRGAYQLIRHPMYAGLLLLCAGAALCPPMAWKIAAWTALFLVLDCKSRIEERHLQICYPEYDGYQRQTKRLIPFVW